MYFKQYVEIMERRKDCTQRVVKDGEYGTFDPDGAITAVYDARGRMKWGVGRDYAVAPGRGQLSVMVLWHWLKPEIYTHRLPKTRRMANELSAINYHPLRIRILRIERPHLHEMDETVAVHEGVASVAAYADLWQSINGHPGTRWEDNPLVWRLWFELMRPTLAKAG